MSAVGFDIGNQNCVIAAAKHRGIDVLLNDDSKSETPAVVSFGKKQRSIGSAGAASATMNLESTISQIKRLIGSWYNEPSVVYDLNLLPFETSMAPDGGILIHLQYMNERHTFTPTQILGMLFVHLKQITEKNLESPLVDCVIGIPSYFTDLQRREYLNAAFIAGLTPLRLMHDCTAIALGYGIYKTDISNSGPTNVIFVDIGHCDTQVAVAAFEHKQMKILSHAFDKNLGGRDFDQVLFKYFATQFNARYNINVTSSARASIRLRASCEKLKKVLSVNAEAHLSIECLIDDKDMEGFITRKEFENLSSELLHRIIMPCQKAVIDSCLAMNDIDCIELVGSGSRIPAIMKTLSTFFQKELRRTLNGSECVARGCALQCAMLSPTLQVRDYEVRDLCPYSIGLCLVKGTSDTPSNEMLFQRGSLFSSSKVYTFPSSTTFYFDVCYTETDLSAEIRQIGSFMIGPFKSDAEKAMVEVKFHLNMYGIVIVESALLLAYEQSSHNDDHLHSKRTEAKQWKDVFTRIVASSSTSTTQHGDVTRKSRVQKLNLKVSGKIHGNTTKDELLKARKKEQMLVEQDMIVEKTKEKRNTLESFVYNTRSKLQSSYQKFVQDSENQEIFKILQETEDWLYNDGDDASEQVYTTKLQDLRMILYPIENRLKHENARAQAERALLTRIKAYHMTANSLPLGQKDEVNNECMKTKQWLNEIIKIQDATPKSIDSLNWSHQIHQKMQDLEKTCEDIMRSKSCYDEPVETNETGKTEGMHVD